MHVEPAELLAHHLQHLVPAAGRRHGPGDQHGPAAHLGVHTELAQLAGGETVLEVGDAVLGTGVVGVHGVSFHGRVDDVQPFQQEEERGRHGRVAAVAPHLLPVDLLAQGAGDGQHGSEVAVVLGERGDQTGEQVGRREDGHPYRLHGELLRAAQHLLRDGAVRQLEDDIDVLPEAGRLDQPVFGRAVDGQPGVPQRGGDRGRVLGPYAEVHVVLEVAAAAVGVHGDAAGQREEPAPLQHRAHLLGRLQDGLVTVTRQIRLVDGPGHGASPGTSEARRSPGRAERHPRRSPPCRLLPPARAPYLVPAAPFPTRPRRTPQRGAGTARQAPTAGHPPTNPIRRPATSRRCGELCAHPGGRSPVDESDPVTRLRAGWGTVRSPPRPGRGRRIRSGDPPPRRGAGNCAPNPTAQPPQSGTRRRTLTRHTPPLEARGEPRDKPHPHPRPRVRTHPSSASPLTPDDEPEPVRPNGPARPVLEADMEQKTTQAPEPCNPADRRLPPEPPSRRLPRRPSRRHRPRRPRCDLSPRPPHRRLHRRRILGVATRRMARRPHRRGGRLADQAANWRRNRRRTTVATPKEEAWAAATREGVVPEAAPARDDTHRTRDTGPGDRLTPPAITRPPRPARQGRRRGHGVRAEEGRRGDRARRRRPAGRRPPLPLSRTRNPMLALLDVAPSPAWRAPPPGWPAEPSTA